MLFIKAWSLSRQALRLASVLTDGPSSLSFSQYQSQPCSNQSTTTSKARQRPMHSSAFPWQLEDQKKVPGFSFYCMHPVSLLALQIDKDPLLHMIHIITKISPDAVKNNIISEIIWHTSDDGRTCPLSPTVLLHRAPVKNHQTIKASDKLIKHNILCEETRDEH